VAEDLFWLGRYAERAEGVARLVAIADNRWRDVHPAADPAVPHCLNVLLEVLSGLSDDPLGEGGDIAARLRSLVADERRPGTVAHDVRQLRELASAVRDQLSGDTWSVLARLERAIAPLAPPSTTGDIAPAITVIIEALLAFAGLGAESMVRDSGWHLLDAGRRTERALQALRLIQVALRDQVAPGVEQLVNESVLIAAESVITHRRRYGATAGVDTVLGLLLVDRDNPRAVTYQLAQLSVDLQRVGGRAVDELVGRVRELEAVLHDNDPIALARPQNRRRVDLVQLTTELIDGLHQLAEAIAVTHFPQGGELQSFPSQDRT
jgi:uncharacterized alpha-E superfamily protein